MTAYGEFIKSEFPKLNDELLHYVDGSCSFDKDVLPETNGYELQELLRTEQMNSRTAKSCTRPSDMCWKRSAKGNPKVISGDFLLCSK